MNTLPIFLVNCLILQKSIVKKFRTVMLTLCEACNQQDIQYSAVQEDNDDTNRDDHNDERMEEEENSERRVNTDQEDLFFTSFTSTIFIRCRY